MKGGGYSMGEGGDGGRRSMGEVAMHCKTEVMGGRGDARPG